ncbi:MAG: FAD-dependent oxidoreductase [Desulfobacteraceae bacterium]|nr:FAD-dependent oxidoreductase [Desulfobacteraceae bacterium]
MEKFDVIIIGAGIAGLASAYTSVKNGLRCALVEKNHHSGGIAKDCFHTYICGLFKNDRTNSFQIANKGICSDVFNFLHNCYGDKCLISFGKVETIAFKQEDLWNFFLNRLNQNEKFSFFKNTECVEILPNQKKGKKIQTIRLSAQKNDFYLKADVFIDATGCAGLTCKNEEPDNSSNSPQLGGFCMLLEGGLNKELSLLVPYTARKIIQKYNFDDYLKYITITYNFLTKHHILKFSVKKPDDIKKCKFIYQKLNKKIDQLSKLKFLKSSERIHLRTCNQTMINDASLKNKDNQNDLYCVKSYWPVEKWIENKGPQYEYIKNNKPFLIPGSALKDNKFDNLFLAGKSIKVSERLHASTRVMGVSMATGEQALLNAFNYLKEN